MGMRQPARLSPRPAYGVPDVALANEHAGVPSGVLPLLILVIALAVATVWYVALPVFDSTPRAERTCEVVVLKSGATACVSDPTPGSRVARHKSASR